MLEMLRDYSFYDWCLMILVCSFIGFLIYLEKLVIKGWNLDQNTQSNMKLRSFSELNIRLSKESRTTFDGEDNDF